MAGMRGIGKPRIKKNYGQSIGRIKQNVMRKTVRGGVKLRSQGVKKFGYSFGGN